MKAPAEVELSFNAAGTEPVRVARFLASLVCILSPPWFIYAFAVGDYLLFPAIFTFFVPALIVLGLIKLGFSLAARIFWLAALPITMLGNTLVYPPEVHSETLFFCAIGFPFLVFSWKTERVYTIGSALLMYLAALPAFATSILELHDWFWPYPHLEVIYPQGNALGVYLSVAFLILAQIFYFVANANRAQEKADRARRSAETAARVKGEFLANMSHEIRTPMNGLIGMIEVLENIGLDQKQEQAVGTIRNSAFSLLRIIDDILDASKIEAGKLDVTPSRVELRPLIEAATQTLMTTSDQLGVRLALIPDAGLPTWVSVDAGRLRQILLNLLSNGVKFSAQRLTGREGKVRLEVDQTADGAIVFRVSDNGIGMNEETQAQLFQPFAQGESSSRRRVEGTGLGLLISKNLVELMDGTLEMTSTEGEGTTITATLPLTPLEGPKNRPDLENIEVLLFDPDVKAFLGDFSKVLYTMSPDIRYSTELEDFFPDKPCHARSSKPVMISLTLDEACDEHARETLAQFYPDMLFIRCSNERHARYGQIDTKSFALQIYPLRTSELYDALETLFASTTDDATASPGTEPALIPAKALEPIDKNTKKKRILVVEDNPINQIVLSKQLELLGYAYDLASNGHEGLEMWQGSQYDLILSDCHMPLMDGFEMTAAIRTAETKNAYPPIPIVAVTANVQKGEAEKCLSYGMNDYLSKPVELKALNSRLDAYL